MGNRIWREAEMKRRQIVLPPTGFGRKPSFLLMILLVMGLIGGLLLGRAKQKFPENKRTPEELAQARVLAGEKYRTEAWIRRR